MPAPARPDPAASPDAGASPGARVSPDALVSPDVLCGRPATQLASLLRRGEVSATELVTAHLDRIAAHNGDVNAVVTLAAERALAEAAAADARYAAGRMHAEGEALPPLHGLPVLIKDTHDTAGIRTTYGSRIFRDHVPADDELVVARIRRAGGIVLGKTNAPEFGAGSHTFNEVFGLTRNPHDLTRSAGGSSGGAAAALACGFAPLADGSDMGGSLRNPASFCGVAGLRPSPGRVPSFPADFGYSTLSVQGPMARTVADVALLLSVIAGPDDRCPISLPDSGLPDTGAGVAELPLLPARRLRVAFAPDLGGALPVEPEVTDVLLAAATACAGLGWEVEEACPDLSGAEESFRTLRALQFAAGLGPLLDRHPDLFKATLAGNIDQGRRLTPGQIGRAEVLRTGVYRRTVAFFADYDLLICPAAQVAPFDAALEYPPSINGVPQRDYLDWMRAAYWITMTGCPALSLPAGFTPSGLPVGAQLVARPRADHALLAMAAALEPPLSLK